MPDIPGITPNLARYNLETIRQYTQPKKPGGFRRFLGAVAGGVANVFAPGAGTLLGNFIGGGGSQSALSSQALGGLGGLSTLGGAGLLNDSMRYLRLQQQIQQQSQLVQMTSNIMKARHDMSMAAIRNIR